jgi:hypothetical protein
VQHALALERARQLADRLDELAPDEVRVIRQRLLA